MASDGYGYWGLCPTCKETDGFVNLGRGHWFICKKHRTRWFIGSNLFSSWRNETEAEQRRELEEIGFDSFEDVEPFYPEIEGVQRLTNDGDDDENPGVKSKKLVRPPLIRARRHRNSTT